jgi:hypothetical protein
VLENCSGVVLELVINETLVLSLIEASESTAVRWEGVICDYVDYLEETLYVAAKYSGFLVASTIDKPRNSGYSLRRASF